MWGVKIGFMQLFDHVCTFWRCRCHFLIPIARIFKCLGAHFFTKNQAQGSFYRFRSTPLFMLDIKDQVRIKILVTLFTFWSSDFYLRGRLFNLNPFTFSFFKISTTPFSNKAQEKIKNSLSESDEKEFEK